MFFKIFRLREKIRVTLNSNWMFVEENALEKVFPTTSHIIKGHVSWGYHLSLEKINMSTGIWLSWLFRIKRVSFYWLQRVYFTKCRKYFKNVAEFDQPFWLALPTLPLGTPFNKWSLKWTLELLYLALLDLALYCQPVSCIWLLKCEQQHALWTGQSRLKSSLKYKFSLVQN